jgi:hypothetical protein
MKKIFLTNAVAILLVAAFGMLTACSGHFVDPGWAAEANSLLSGGGDDNGGGNSWDDDDTGGGNSWDDDDDDDDGGSRPAKLAGNASYSQALAKVDEIIAYCGDDTSMMYYKEAARSYRLAVTTAGSSGWSIASETLIYSINALIDTLP